MDGCDEMHVRHERPVATIIAVAQHDQIGPQPDQQMCWEFGGSAGEGSYTKIADGSGAIADVRFDANQSTLPIWAPRASAVRSSPACRWTISTSGKPAPSGQSRIS